MVNEVTEFLSGVVVEEDNDLSLAELCRLCSLSAEQIITMIDFGVIEPLQPSGNSSHWKFSAASLLRLQIALRLQRDLDVNLAGAGLALELLDEIKELRQLVEFLKRQ